MVSHVVICTSLGRLLQLTLCPSKDSSTRGLVVQVGQLFFSINSLIGTFPSHQAHFAHQIAVMADEVPKKSVAFADGTGDEKTTAESHSVDADVDQVTVRQYTDCHALKRLTL